MQFFFNADLTKAERKMFTERLITLHTVLGEDTTTEYKHQVWTEQTPNGFFKQLVTGKSCGTAGCAVGHALWHHERFPGMPFADDRPAIQVLGLENERHTPLKPTPETFEYFGPDSLRYIFSPRAYDKPPENVTRADAMQRIEDYIGKVLGCQLIEAT